MIIIIYTFLNTPNQATLFKEQVPLDYMKEHGLYVSLNPMPDAIKTFT